MKQIAAPLLVAAMLAAPASAQEDNRSLMEEGIQLFFKGLMSEMEPALNELERMTEELEPFLRDMAEEMGPALRGLMDEVDDWSNYHAPEILPNGDIIMRKKSAKEMEEQPEIEL